MTMIDEDAGENEIIPRRINEDIEWDSVPAKILLVADEDNPAHLIEYPKRRRS
jgi:hypothetical protein